MKNALSSVTEQFCILLPLWDIVSFCVIFQELRTETDKLELLITQVNNDVDVLSADEVFGEVDELTELLMQVNSKWQSLRSHVTTTEHNFQILEENYPTFTGNVRILQLLSLKISTSLRMGHLSCMAPRSGWVISPAWHPAQDGKLLSDDDPAQDGSSLLHGTPLRMGHLSWMAPRSRWVISPAWHPAQDGSSLLHGAPLRMGRLSCMAQGWKFKILLPRSFVPWPTEYTRQVSSTSAQRSQSLGVLKMLTPYGHTEGWTFDWFYKSSWERRVLKYSLTTVGCVGCWLSDGDA